MNLYRVTLKGMTSSSTGTVHGVSYVVASNLDVAYNMVREELYKKDIGFSRERELDKIEVIASKNYGASQFRLYIEES